MAKDFAESLEQLGWKAPFAGLVTLVVSMIYLGIWSPHRLHAFYKRQNVPGPKYWPLIGNSIEIRELRSKHGIYRRQPPHPADVALQNVPHLSRWSKIYGSVFTFMEGVEVSLCVLDTEMVREVLVSKADCYRKSSARWFNSILRATGSIRPTHGHTCRLKDMMDCEPQRWSTLRRILVPGAPDQQTVQGGLQKIMDHCNGLVRRWKVLLDGTRVEDGFMDVDSTRDIVRISMHILFTNLIGSTLSSRDWETIDSLVNSEEDELISATTPFTNTHCCGFRSNKDDRLNLLLTETVEARFRASKGDAAGQQEPGDFLDLMVASCYRRGAMEDVRRLVEDCKMMVAAQRSTTLLVNNTLLLLARHTDWQVHARAEVLHVQPLSYVISEDEKETAIYPSLANLKILNMILNESLRLLPPIMFIEKICQKRHRLGKYKVLPGTLVQIPVVLVHHSQELWGEDSISFRPNRFHKEERRKPFAFLPFSAGPSVCLGFNFALQEAKLILASILSNFFFTLSPDYVTYGSDYPNARPLSIRRLQADDLASAAKDRLSRSRSSYV